MLGNNLIPLHNSGKPKVLKWCHILTSLFLEIHENAQNREQATKVTRH